ncbi:MAG: hypothetical protein JXR78_11615 [Victivallales bacterium]|nr:hypothetical protein [Victivallales bacterium]
MNRFKVMTITKNLLLIFVLISIGFAMGRRFAAPGALLPVGGSINDATAVHVYYFHSTFRCTTCNTIEQMTKDLLEKNFKAELESGAIIFSEVNFQENEKLAILFDVVASCVVVSVEKDGQVIDFLRLDEVWTKLSNRAGFDKYISDAIAAMKKKLKQGETL